MYVTNFAQLALTVTNLLAGTAPDFSRPNDWWTRRNLVFHRNVSGEAVALVYYEQTVTLHEKLIIVA